MKPVYVCKNPHEKAMQRALIQYRNPKNYELVKEALLKAGREDLIGFDKKCLIRPRNIPMAFEGQREKNGNGDSKKGKGQRNHSPKNQAFGGNVKGSSKKNAANTKEKQSAKPKKRIRNVHKKKQK